LSYPKSLQVVDLVALGGVVSRLKIPPVEVCDEYRELELGPRAV
jgi:hypothetical protein